jgi:hypothetical protein
VFLPPRLLLKALERETLAMVQQALRLLREALSPR